MKKLNLEIPKNTNEFEKNQNKKNQKLQLLRKQKTKKIK